jgi:hypothetical protein
MVRHWTTVVTLMLVASLGAVWAGEAAPEAEAEMGEKPECYQHSLKNSLCKFSWQLNERPWYEHVLWYVPNRALDLLDCVGVEIGAGQGIHANVHATRLLQLGAGQASSTRVGLMSRYPLVVEEDLDEATIGWWWDLDLQRETVAGAAPAVDLNEDQVCARYNPAVDPAGIGVAIFPGIIGANVELKLHEVLDFAKGFLTIDSLEDDH